MRLGFCAGFVLQVKSTESELFAGSTGALCSVVMFTFAFVCVCNGLNNLFYTMQFLVGAGTL